MDPITARMECLKLAADHSKSAEEVLKKATLWSDFVIGAKVVEHASQTKKGADDHLAAKK